MPRLHGLECRPHCEFCFAKANVAAQKPVHGTDVLHVAANRLDRRDLIGRLVKRKRFLKRPLPRSVGGEGDARSAFAFGLQLNHFCSHIGDRFLDGQLLFCPERAADLGQLRRHLGATDIFLDQFDAGCGHIHRC